MYDFDTLTRIRVYDFDTLTRIRVYDFDTLVQKNNSKIFFTKNLKCKSASERVSREPV